MTATPPNRQTGDASNQDPLKRRVLIVDDDDLIPASLRLALPSNWSMSVAAAKEEAERPELTSGIVAAFVDMHLTKGQTKAEGLDVIRSLRARHAHLEIVAMSGDLDRNLMELGLKSGATRFLAKPIGAEEFQLTLEKIEALLLLREAVVDRRGETRWVGRSQASTEVLRRIADFRGERGPILIEGESGTGKEVAASLLHAQEPGTRPFIRVNLGGIPETVFESELFGHMKGAFTGADRNKMGLVEAAAEGDLFLDEIEALPLASQAKLLRFLESGESRRVGSSETTRVNVRVIAATNRDLASMVKAGEFREDLMWRVSGKRLRIPALRERMEDLVPLAENFVSLERPRRNKSLATDAIEALKAHRWSGNVRELKRICEQLCLLAPLPIIRAQDVHACLPFVSSGVSQEKSSPADLSLGLVELVARYEALVIREALQQSTDIDDAAERIGISRSSMYKKMKDYGIERA